MKITQEKLKEIIASHGKWLRCENGGERANLCNADLCGADLRGADLCAATLRNATLRGADLRNADLCNADLCDANLCNANLRDANLRNADLCDANLRNADLCGANLCNANLCGADLCKTYYQIVRIGSREATTTYCVEDDNVRCGCWHNYGGGTLEEFKKRVESVYGENGKRPNKKYYDQYMAAIEFFEKMAKKAKKEEE